MFILVKSAGVGSMKVKGQREPARTPAVYIRKRLPVV